MLPLRSICCAATLVLALASSSSAQDGVDLAAKRAAATRLRPGDRIELHFLRERDLSGGVTVSERGETTFPKLGVMRVDALTIGELKDTLRVRYSEYLRSPEFEVSVLRRVVVNGEVKVPNVYMVDVNSTVRDVIARAGGLTEMGSRSRVSIVRGNERIDAKGWDREVTSGSTTDLQSGDQVVVGRKNWLVVNAIPAISTAVLLGSFVLTVAR